MADIQFVVITGLSGAGKSEAMRCFEDLGFFCVDNIPPALIPKFAELCAQTGGRVHRIALVSDIRGGAFFDTLLEALDQLEQVGIPVTILFLEASDEVLVRRFKQTRRRHPLGSAGGAAGQGGALGLLEGIRAERERLRQLRDRAHRIIDTSHLAPRELFAEISRLFGQGQQGQLQVTVLSFGYKRGLPLDADLVFDVRFLPNPHYIEELRPLTGREPQVADYVLGAPLTRAFLQHLKEFIAFLLPHFVEEGKRHLVVAIGCTGGRHRSVAVADWLGTVIRELGYPVAVEHRDVARVDD